MGTRLRSRIHWMRAWSRFEWSHGRDGQMAARSLYRNGRMVAWSRRRMNDYSHNLICKLTALLASCMTGPFRMVRMVRIVRMVCRVGVIRMNRMAVWSYGRIKIEAEWCRDGACSIKCSAMQFAPVDRVTKFENPRSSIRTVSASFGPACTRRDHTACRASPTRTMGHRQEDRIVRSQRRMP
jgi:hypothetical protein